TLADLPQLRWRVGRVERIVSTVEPRADVVVLDPPRKGAGAAVVGAIAAAGPERVVYVACDPAALARDVATFDGHGYRLRALRAFDAFPMTQHVECIALLERCVGARVPACSSGAPGGPGRARHVEWGDRGHVPDRPGAASRAGRGSRRSRTRRGRSWSP